MQENDFQALVLEKLNKLEYILSGNGSPEKGLSVRVVLLEDKVRRAEQNRLAIWGAVGTSAVAFAAQLLQWILK